MSIETDGTCITQRIEKPVDRDFKKKQKKHNQSSNSLHGTNRFRVNGLNVCDEMGRAGFAPVNKHNRPLTCSYVLSVSKLDLILFGNVFGERIGLFGRLDSIPLLLECLTSSRLAGERRRSQRGAHVMRGGRDKRHVRSHVHNVIGSLLIVRIHDGRCSEDGRARREWWQNGRLLR